MTKASALRVVDFSESNWNTRTTSYTVQLSDAASIMALSAASTTPMLSVTVPNNNFPKGFSFSVVRFGERRVTLVPGPGVIFKISATSYELAVTNSIGSAVYSGSPTSGWLLFGDYL